MHSLVLLSSSPLWKTPSCPSKTKRTWVVCLVFFLYSTNGQTPVRAHLLKDAVTAALDPSTSRAHPQTHTHTHTHTHILTASIFDAVESYKGAAAPLWNTPALCFWGLFRLFSTLSEEMFFSIIQSSNFTSFKSMYLCLNFFFLFRVPNLLVFKIIVLVPMKSDLL